MLENLTAKELVQSMHPVQVKNLYRESIESRNALTLATTMMVLAKRGDYDAISEILMDMFQHGLELKNGFAFTTTLGDALFELRNASPFLGRLGKDINRVMCTDEETKYGLDDVEKLFDETKKSSKYIDENGPTSTVNWDPLKVVSQLSREEMDKYLDNLTARDIVNMKSGLWEMVVLHFVERYLREGESRADATKHALRDMKIKLSDRIVKIQDDPKNKDQMKARVISDLEIKFQ